MLPEETQGMPQIRAEEIQAERYRMLISLHGPAIADVLHCEQEHIGLELDELIADRGRLTRYSRKFK